MLNKLKDMGTSKAASIWLNGKISRYAEIRKLTINSQSRQALLVLRPLGESEEVELKVEKYDLSQRDEQHYVKVDEISCSRQWLQSLAEDLLVGREFSIPSFAAMAL